MVMFGMAARLRGKAAMLARQAAVRQADQTIAPASLQNVISSPLMPRA